MQRTRVLLLMLVVLALCVLGAWLLLGKRIEVERGAGELSESSRGPTDATVELEDGEGSAPAEAREHGATVPKDPDGLATFPGEKALLRGRVLDPGRAPIAGAEVELRFQPASGLDLLNDMHWQDERVLLARVRTDGSGEFVFHAPRARALEVVATATGFAPGRDSNAHAGSTIEIVLARACELVGRVTRASDAAPVAGAEILVFHDAIEGALHEGRTDAGGNYVAAGLPPGEVSIVVVPEVELPQNVMEIALVAGARVVRDVVVEEGLSATGIVRDAATKRPIVGAEVSSWSFLHKTVRTDATGRYRLTGLRERPVPSLAARAKGYGPSEFSVPSLSARQYVADFELVPGRAVKGRVVDLATRPVVGAYVAAVGSVLGADERDEQDDVHSARTDADGRFSITDLHAHARHYLFVRASGRADAFVPFPNSEATERALDLGTIVLVPPCALEGRVVGSVDGAPIADVIVELHLDVDVETAASPWAGRNPFGASFRGARTDARGAFAFADLAPGRYRARFYREGLRALEAVVIDVPPEAGLVERMFEMKTDGTILGRVVDPWGSGIEGALVSAKGAGGDARVPTEKEGAFALGGLEDGEYVVEASFTRDYELAGVKHALASAAVSGVRTGTRNLVLQLATRVEIAGVVLDEGGAPFANAGVEAVRADGTIADVAFADGDGVFQLKVAAEGEYEVRAHPSELIEADRMRRFRMQPSEQRSAAFRGVRAGARGVELRFGVRR